MVHAVFEKMRTGILFLIFCVLSRTDCTKNSSSIMSRLPDVLQYLCPGANVCSENKTIQTPQKSFGPGYGSCCVECSCGSDCETNGNCCFPSKQPYTNGNEQFDSVFQRRRVCLFPTPLELQGEQTLSYQSYYMISAVSGNKTATSTQLCGDTTVAPWGSLFPVYSRKRKQIYKNIACATEDDVKDGELWDAYFKCNVKLDDSFRTFDPGNFLDLAGDSDFGSRNCHVSFIYQGSINEIQPLKCYRDVINVCPDPRLFQITDEFGFSNEEVTEACINGLVSPYRQEKMYANVFCHICNQEQFAKESRCPQISNTFTQQRNPFGNSFAGLIDGDVFLTEVRKEGHSAEQTNTKTVCYGKNKAGCRPVLCPSGQLYDPSGKCRYPIRFWYNLEFMVYLTLTAEEDITGVIQEDITSTLKSPWPRSWLFSDIEYEETTSNVKSTRLLVKLKRHVDTVRPSYLIETVNKMVKMEWSVELKNKKHVLKSDFSTVTIQRSQSDFIRLGDRIENITMIPNYITIYRDSYTMSLYVGQIITRLYLCNQVELTRSEFILSESKTVLFNVITRRYMFSGEFTFILSDEFEDFHVRICVEDSGLFEISVAAILNSNIVIFCIWVSFVT